MGYTNSSLVAYTKLSPNHSGQRNHAIDRITPHCVVGQCSAEGLGDWFARSSTQASSNYGIDKDGRVGLYVEEANRSWCSSSSANDQRAVTIECASDTQEPYWMNDKVYATLIQLCADICRRNGKTRLLWLGEKDKTLAYAPAADEMVLTHRLNCFPPEYPPIEKPANLRDARTLAGRRGVEPIFTPGHTPGGMCFYFPKEKLLLSGDTLFAGSVGRTDLPGGDMATLMDSVRALKALPDDTEVVPGHGMFTSIGREKASNPFLI